MTLSKLMFYNFLYIGCAGNKSAVARELKIHRPRVNSILSELELGSSLGPTMPRLLMQYRRHGMDINAVVDLYLEIEDMHEENMCPVHIRLAEARIRWVSMEKSLHMTVTNGYEQAKLLAAYLEAELCHGYVCSKDCDEKCPCWWMAGLLDSLLKLLTDERLTR